MPSQYGWSIFAEPHFPAVPEIWALLPMDSLLDARFSFPAFVGRRAQQVLRPVLHQLAHGHELQRI